MTIRLATNRKMLILPQNSGRTELVETPASRDAYCNRRTGGAVVFGHAARAAVLLGLTFVFLSSQGPLLAQPGKAKEVPEEAKPATAGAAGGAVDPHEYRIGAEDVLGIRVWREPELSGSFTVRPDGKITLPLCGEVMAGGLTPVELTKIVKDAYSKLVNSPEVMLQVEMVRSKKYFLVGEVNKAGSYPLVVQTTILDAINAAGGLKEFANEKNITIIRGDKRIKFNYKEVIKGKHLEQNILLENGDHIVVR